MSCITQLLEIKGDKEILPIHSQAVIEGGGSYKGYEYLITFTRHGNRCGYVAIPDGHRGDCADFDCHGGITFSGTDHGAKDLLPIACNDLWIGFDAAHYMDKHDMVLAKKYFPDLEPDIIRAFSIGIMGENGKHRTYEYMEDQCQYLINQLVDSQEQ